MSLHLSFWLQKEICKLESRIKRLFDNAEGYDAFFISSYPNIFYYSGFESEDGFLLITQERRILITDSRYTVQAKEQAPDFEIIDIASGLKKVFSGIKENIIGFEDSHMTVSGYERIKDALSDWQELKNAQIVINAPRLIKDDEEIKKIEEAERMGDEAFSYVLNIIKPGISENDVALELEFFMKKHGASALSFDTISASGIRGAMPHGRASDKIIESGELLTLDFGCVFHGYCSDMTRTVAVGKVADWQREIYDVVLKAQTEALSAIISGKKCSEIDTVARNIIKEAGYGENFGHALGHSVGIEIHEEPRLSPKCDTVIENGHVLTVEPGIYIENKGGVRIEDLIVVKNGGIVNLTHSEKKLIIL